MILIHNYCTTTSSEPLYLFQALQQSGIDCHLWADNTSAFDMFDRTKPKVFVSHYKFLTQDIFEYLKQNNKIKLAMNVTGASESQIESLKTTLSEIDIEPFLFSNDYSKSSSVHTLYPAADIFQPPSQLTNIPSKIDTGIISQEISQDFQDLTCKKDVYHILYMGSDDEYDGFDLRVDIRSLRKLIQLYKNISVFGTVDFCTSQLFFDLCLYCPSVSVKSDDDDGFQKIMSELFNESKATDVKKELKQQIKSRHTPFHRAARLLKILGEKEAMGKVENVKSQLHTALKDF